MRLLVAVTGIGLALAVMLPTDAKALCVSRSHLSGQWSSDDGGSYHVRRNAGNVVWWVGQSGDGGRSWTNVFKGVYDPNTNLITGDWADVISSGVNFGSLTLRLNGSLEHVNGFDKVSGNGSGFGGTRWFFHCADN
jgi:hypothetical protein